jgi:hypothetical protein
MDCPPVIDAAAVVPPGYSIRAMVVRVRGENVSEVRETGREVYGGRANSKLRKAGR